MILTGRLPARAASGCAPSANLRRSSRPAATATLADSADSAKPALVEGLDKPVRQEPIPDEVAKSGHDLQRSRSTEPRDKP